MIPANRFSEISREVLNLATMRPDLPGVRNNFVYTPGDAINTNPWNKFSSSSITICPVTIGWGSSSIGARCWSSAKRRARGRAARSAEQLPRRRFAYLCLSRELGPGYRSNVAEPRDVRAQQLVAASRLVQPRSGLGNEDRFEECARTRAAVSADRFFARLSRLGPIGMGRLRELPLGTDRRSHVGEGETHMEVRLHGPAGSLRRIRMAYGGRHLQLQPRRDFRLPAQRDARYDRRLRERICVVPARRGAVVRDHDESLCVGPLAILLRRTRRTTGV